MHSHAERGNDQMCKPAKINCGSCRALARLRWRTGRRHIYCLTGPLRSLAEARQRLRRILSARDDRSHALRGNATSDALRPADDARFKSCAVVTRERHRMYSHAERRNDQMCKPAKINCGSCRASARLRWRTGRRYIYYLTGPLRSLAKARQLLRRILSDRDDRSHALRGNAASDALRPADDARFKFCAVVTRSVTGCIPTQSVGTIRTQYSSLGRSTVGAVELQRGCDGGLAGDIFIA